MRGQLCAWVIQQLRHALYVPRTSEIGWMHERKRKDVGVSFTALVTARLVVLIAFSRTQYRVVDDTDLN